MKIYIISNYFYPEIGAAPKRISEMALGLSMAGNHVEVVCPMPNYPYGKILKKYRGKHFLIENFKEVVVRRYWISPSISNKALTRGWSMISFSINLFFEIWHLRKYKADCIIVQNSPLLVSYMGIKVAKLVSHSKLVLNISDLWPLSALELDAIQPGRLYRLFQRIERFNYLNSHLIVGQSDEIIQHVAAIAPKATFLYRNFSSSQVKTSEYKEIPDRFTIIYAGLLGLAQGVLDIIKSINFKSFGTELHIYGNGNETVKITEYIQANPDHGIKYKGVLPHEEIKKILPNYKAALIPLRTSIKGAVPSKIFEMAAAGIPILFCGGGEGETIVNEFNLGLTSPPNNFEALSVNIYRITTMPINEYLLLRESCRKASKDHFSFDRQMQEFVLRLNELVI